MGEGLNKINRALPIHHDVTENLGLIERLFKDSLNVLIRRKK
jgi:hypothetical protein